MEYPSSLWFSPCSFLRALCVSVVGIKNSAGSAIDGDDGAGGPGALVGQQMGAEGGDFGPCAESVQWIHGGQARQACP